MLWRLAYAVAVCTTAFCAGPPDAKDIITRSVAAEAENRSHMVNYLFREEIRRTSFDFDHRPLSTHVTAHEVVFIEGRPAFRQVSIDGRPLTPEEDRAERIRLRQLAEDRRRNPQGDSAAEERRRAHPFATFLQLHEFRLAGEEILDGRLCWVIDSKPRGRFKLKTSDDRRVASASARFWIDRETLHRAGMDVTALKAARGSGKREWTSYRWAPRDGSVWLITSVSTLLPVKHGLGDIAWYEGQQTYSDYRRFTSDSVLSSVHEVGEPE